MQVLPLNKIKLLPDDYRTSLLLKEAMNTEVAIQWEESTAVVQSGPTLQGWRLPEALADSGQSQGHAQITWVRKQGEGKERTATLKENYIQRKNYCYLVPKEKVLLTSTTGRRRPDAMLRRRILTFSTLFILLYLPMKFTYSY